MNRLTEETLTHEMSAFALGLIRDWPRYFKDLLCVVLQAISLPFVVILCRDSGERFTRFTLFAIGWIFCFGGFVFMEILPCSDNRLDQVLLILLGGLSLGCLLDGKIGCFEQEKGQVYRNSYSIGMPRGQQFWNWLCWDSPAVACGAAALPWFVGALFFLPYALATATLILGTSFAWWFFLLLDYSLKRENMLDVCDAIQKLSFPVSSQEGKVAGDTRITTPDFPQNPS